MAGLLGSGLKAHFEMNQRSLLRPLALSFIPLTAVKRGVSSAKGFALVFSSLGKSLI